MLKRATEKQKKHLYNINKNNKYKNNTAAKTCPKKSVQKKKETEIERANDQPGEISQRALVKAFNLQLFRPLTNLL